jgi:hypothetical protein
MYLFITYAQKKYVVEVNSDWRIFFVILIDIPVTMYQIVKNKKKRCLIYGKTELKYNNLPEQHTF